MSKVETHERRAWSFRTPSRPVILAIILPILLGSAAGLISLQLGISAHHDQSAQLALVRLQAALNQQSALEWQAIADESVDSAVAEQLKEQRDLSHGLVGPDSEIHLRDAADLRALLTEYEAAVDDELKLLERGDVEAALEVDEERVDPAFEETAEEIDKLVERYGERVAIADTTARVGSLLALLGAAVTIGFLFVRVQRYQRRMLMEIADRRASESGRAQLHALMRHSSDATLVLNAQGQILHASGAIKMFTRRDENDIVGICFGEFLKVGDRATLHGLLEASASQEGPQNAAFEVVSKHGSNRIVEVVCSNALDDAWVNGFILNIRDITERKLLEGEILEGQKMQALGRMAGGIAHDFNNILAIILSSATFLAEDLGSNDPRSADAQAIADASERAAKLVRQLLTYSRRDMQEPEIVDVVGIVRSTAEMIRRTLPEDIDLTTKLEPTVHVFMDAGNLEQMILNLVTNSVQAIEGGGEVEISTTDVTFDEGDSRPAELTAGPYVRIEVRDTGCGIPPDSIGHIFEPFFSTKPLGQGTGLGLASVYGAVTSAGGAVDVDSEVGVGTTFTIHLPAAPAPTAGVTGNAGGDEPTVLVVDDEPQLRDLAARILAGSGFDVLRASSSAEALAITARVDQRIDLLLTDVVMPKMGGIELARRLLSEDRCGEVLYMSGYSDEASFGDHPDLRARFIGKPFTRADLVERVRSLLHSKDESTLRLPPPGGTLEGRISAES